MEETRAKRRGRTRRRKKKKAGLDKKRERE
jgi:hypothetical protein